MLDILPSHNIPLWGTLIGIAISLPLGLYFQPRRPKI